MLYTSQQTAEIQQHFFTFLKVEEQNHVLTLTLNRPEKKNALSSTLLHELAFGLSYAHHNSAIWVVVIKATGDVWCAGMDLKAMMGQSQTNKSTIPEPAEAVVLGDLFTGLHKPCIAQVHAPVYAGGFLIVGGCTHVLASENATFSLPEVKRGLFPFQVLNTLLQLMPARKALDWCMRGKTLSAQQAYEVGLVTELTAEENLDNAVNELVADLLLYSPTAIQKGLEVYQNLPLVPPHERHGYLLAQFLALQQTEDAKEGIAAFNEKRKPIWRGE